MRIKHCAAMVMLPTLIVMMAVHARSQGGGYHTDKRPRPEDCLCP